MHVSSDSQLWQLDSIKSARTISRSSMHVEQMVTLNVNDLLSRHLHNIRVSKSFSFIAQRMNRPPFRLMHIRCTQVRENRINRRNILGYTSRKQHVSTTYKEAFTFSLKKLRRAGRTRISSDMSAETLVAFIHQSPAHYVYVHARAHWRESHVFAQEMRISEM